MTTANHLDPVARPALAKAPTEPDRAVDRCYCKDRFPQRSRRVEYLFQLCAQLTLAASSQV